MKEADKNLLQEIALLSRLIKKKEDKNYSKNNVRKKRNFFNNVNPGTYQSSRMSSQYKFLKLKPATDTTLSSSKPTSGVSGVGFPSTSTNKSTYCSPLKLNSPSLMYINPKLLIPQSCELVNLSAGGKVTNEHSFCSANPQRNDELGVHVYQNAPYLRADSFKTDSAIQQMDHKSDSRYKYRRTVKSTNTSCDNAVAVCQDNKSGFCEKKIPNLTITVLDSTNRSVSNHHTRNISTSITKVLHSPVTPPKEPANNQLLDAINFGKINSRNYTRHSLNSYKLDRRAAHSRSFHPISSQTLSSMYAIPRKKSHSKIITRYSIKKTRCSAKLKNTCNLLKSEPKIVRIQGTTYESKNKGKTLNRIRSSNSFSQSNARSDLHSVQRPINKLASRVLKKSKTTLIKSRTKKNIFCKFYNVFGVCKKLKNGTCRFSHDPRQVFVCAKFVVGKCQDENCALSHDLKGKFPPCRFFRKGLCIKKNCPFNHLLSPKKVENIQKKKSSLCSSAGPSTSNKTAVQSGEAECAMKQHPDKSLLKTKVKEHDSRYYKLVAKRSPTKSVIPRRIPIRVIESMEESDDSDSDNSADLDSSCDVDVSDDTSQFESESDLINSNVESAIVKTKPADVNSSGNRDDASNSIVETNDKNVNDPSEGLNNTSIVSQRPEIVAPIVHFVQNSAAGENSTIEKRQRLLGLQQRFKQRVAVIRSNNDNCG